MRGLLAAVLTLALGGVAVAQDVVYYQDRAAKAEAKLVGAIEDEGPSGLKIKLKDGKDTVRQVPAAAITRVEYHDKEVSAVDYRRPFAKEDQGRKADRAKVRHERLAEALEGFTKLEPRLTSPNARRYVQFKIAEVTALQAQDDPAKADAAIKLLTDFKTNHPGGWQMMAALKTLARMQEEAGKVDDARKAYEELADLPEVPAEVKRESTLLVGKLLLRGGKYADAERRLAKLAASLSPGDVQAPFVRAYRAECQLGQNNLTSVVKELTDVIRASADPKLRGLAHNLLGDYYRKKGQPDEALWQYLRVDALYNEDAEEQAKALYHLAGLFDKVKKDPLRGKECASRLLDKRFAGTVYQRLLLQEAKKDAQGP
jgi:tetratricopeptide (TPR) repeat protein